MLSIYICNLIYVGGSTFMDHYVVVESHDY